MKNVIPFTKEIIFKSNIAEISSISLENDFKVEDEAINGNFIVSGDYKSHELSINKDNFKYTLPFTIDIDNDINKDSINLEVEDFSYEFHDDVLKVNIEFSVTGERIKEEKEVEKDDFFEDARSYFEEIERKAQLEELEMDEDVVEEIKDLESKEERDEISDMIDTIDDIKDIKVEEDMEDAKDMILNSTSKDDEYVTYHVHIVKESETIESICKLYEVSSSLVNEYNDVNNVSVGDKLIIPSYVDE